MQENHTTSNKTTWLVCCWISCRNSRTRGDFKCKQNQPFIAMYNPALPNFCEILHKKQPILDLIERLHSIFSETPVVAFCCSPILRDLLVRAKLKSSENNTLCHPPGTFHCNSRGVLALKKTSSASRNIGH